MKLKLKVCGMRDNKNILEVAALSPDFMGFIFYEKSKRYVGEIFFIPKEFPTDINRVGVFVNEKIETILKQVAKHQLNFVQLHGDESAEDCRVLKSKTKVIKAFGIDEDFDFKILNEYKPYVDFFLFDTKTKNYGGTGKTFDWSLLKKYDQQIPFFLSGGLSLENIEEAKNINGLNLYGLDVNSKAELSPGFKDISILKSIFNILNTDY